MKIIALLPIKNEVKTLRECIASLRPVTDLIVIIDDGSSDGSIEIARELGCIVYENSEQISAGWAEHSIRNRLLALGRSLGGTHFICLDGDEMLSSNFIKDGRSKIAALKPGQRITMHWVTLWKDCRHYVSGGSVYADLWKDFIFCDDGRMSHGYAFLGVGRTPGPAVATVKLADEEGVVLHFQYAAWEKTQIKQAWYRCSELIKGGKSARKINNTYSISLDDKRIRREVLPEEWIGNLAMPSDLDKYLVGSRLEDIMAFFDKYGIEFFEPLQIWHIEALKNEFIKRVGRNPKSDVFPRWLVKLNDLKNKLKNKI